MRLVALALAASVALGAGVAVRSKGAESGAVAPFALAGELSFSLRGQRVASVKLADLARELPAEEVSMVDPYYGKPKRFRGWPLGAVLARGFGTSLGEARTLELVLRASDGYSVAFTREQAAEEGAFVAFADVEVPGWEPIGPRRANPGPAYLVWAKPHQQHLETHPRPWQLASLEAVRFDEAYPHTAPTGEPEGSPAMRGYATFRTLCFACHAINREGGRVGPELNVPQSIVEYREAPQIRAYVKNPRAFRYGLMPPHPTLGEPQLDELLAYFHAMKSRKHDPEATP